MSSYNAAFDKDSFPSLLSLLHDVSFGVPITITAKEVKERAKEEVYVYQYR